MAKLLTRDKTIELLIKHIDATFSTRTEAAEFFDMTPQYLSLILSGRRNKSISDSMMNFIVANEAITLYSFSDDRDDISDEDVFTINKGE